MKVDPINTKGRRAKEVIASKIIDIKNTEHISKKYSLLSKAGSSITSTITKESKSHHVTIEEEKAILNPYFENQNSSNEKIGEVLESLLKLSSDYWTKKKVKDTWRYVQRKNKKNNDWDFFLVNEFFIIKSYN